MTDRIDSIGVADGGGVEKSVTFVPAGFENVLEWAAANSSDDDFDGVQPNNDNARTPVLGSGEEISRRRELCRDVNRL